ncbi:MAG: DUF2304 family protein [Candidatus Woesearchaeota archaeon]
MELLFIMFRILLFIVIFLTLLKVYKQFKEGNLTFNQLFIWIFVWISFLIMLLIPDLLSIPANLLGVASPYNLFVYSSIFVLFYLIYRVYIKLEKIERDITKIVRKDSKEEFKNNFKR